MKFFHGPFQNYIEGNSIMNFHLLTIQLSELTIFNHILLPINSSITNINTQDF